MQEEPIHLDLKKKLIDSSIFLDSVFEASPTSMWVSDEHGTLIRMNDACRETLQITDADVVGKYNIFRDNIIESQGFMPMVKEVFTKKKTARFTVIYDTAAVNELTLAKTVNLILDVSISPIVDEHAKVLHAIIQHKDITAKTKMEAELKLSNDRVRNLIENLHVGILQQGPHAEILMTNEKALELLGLTKDQLLGKTSFDPDWNVIHEDGSDFPGSTHPVPAAIATEKPVRDVVMGVYRPKTKDREWLLVNAEPEFKTNGELDHVVCTFSSISEKKQIEDEKKYQLKRYKMLLETSQDAIYILDEKGKLVECNLSFIKHLGYLKEEIYKLHVWEWDAHFNKEEIFLLLSEAKGKGISFESLHRLKDGSLRNMDIRVHQFPDKNKIYYYASARDITDRLKVEEALRSSENKVRRILNSSFDAIGVHYNGVWEMCNPATVKLFGYSKMNVLIGTPILQVIAGSERERIKEFVRKRMGNGDAPTQYITRGLKSDGTEFDLEVSISDFIQDHKKYAMVILRDISLQKIHELEMLRLNHDLRELAIHSESTKEEERSSIAKEIHDELAQNLVALSMNASYLKSKLKKEENRLVLDDQIEIANELINTSRTLFNSLHPSMLDEIGLAAAIKWYTKTKLKASSIHFSIDSTVAEELLPKNIRLGLFRIFQESFTNALRHSRSKNISVNFGENNKRVSMLITDDGQGFDTEQVDTQLHHGLLGIRERVYAMSGEFSIHSKIGNGTSIRVEVPIQ